MITYLLIDRIPDTWEPGAVWLLFGFELLIEVFLLSMVVYFVRALFF